MKGGKRKKGGISPVECVLSMYKALCFIWRGKKKKNNQKTGECMENVKGLLYKFEKLKVNLEIFVRNLF